MQLRIRNFLSYRSAMKKTRVKGRFAPGQDYSLQVKITIR